MPTPMRRSGCSTNKSKNCARSSPILSRTCGIGRTAARHPYSGRGRQPGGVGLDLGADSEGMLGNGDVEVVQERVPCFEPRPDHQRTARNDAARPQANATQAVVGDLDSDNLAFDHLTPRAANCSICSSVGCGAACRNKIRSELH
jgi:hypothetical protein